MQAPDRHTTTLLTVALAVAAGDLATKHIAVSLLAERIHDLGGLGGTVRLALLHNDRGAFSVSLGTYTWHLNVAATLGAILLTLPLCRELAAVDRAAPYVLGLIAGAGVGNLVSLVASPAGVPDFVAVAHGRGRELVFNLADVAAYAGLLLLLRPVYAIVRAMRAARRG